MAKNTTSADFTFDPIIGRRRDCSVRHYKELWETMEILPEREQAVMDAALRVQRGWTAYLCVQARTGVPASVIGAIHLMECNCDFQRGIHNGQPWARKTTLTPKGRGPFATWDDGAVFALEYDKMVGKSNWSVGWVAKRLERYNGLGYANRQLESPYLWSFSNHGLGLGKFIGDGEYDPEAVSEQVGCMPLLAALKGVEEVEALKRVGIRLPQNKERKKEASRESGGPRDR
jgi:lysozyme family protein